MMSDDMKIQELIRLLSLRLIVSVILFFSLVSTSLGTDQLPFDIVERFDELNDWKGSCSASSGNYYGYETTPKKLDNSRSIWSYYSCWSNTQPANNWIGDFGPGNSVSGKSLIIDMGGNQGPSRLGTYFGNGTAESGYQDIYLFYRVKFPRNEWPTSINSSTKVGSYAEGSQWAYWYSWKFGTLNAGCTGVNADSDCSGPEPYSSYHVIPHIKAYGYDPLKGKLAIIQEFNDMGGTGRSNNAWALGREVKREEWIGVEFQYKNFIDSYGKSKTLANIWLYDANGEEYWAQKDFVFPFTSQPVSDRFNFFFFGGNNSDSYHWGDTMRSPYYVDDFIIHKSRIGPTYFQIMNGGTSGPSVPDGLRIVNP